MAIFGFILPYVVLEFKTLQFSNAITTKIGFKKLPTIELLTSILKFLMSKKKKIKMKEQKNSLKKTCHLMESCLHRAFS